MLALAVCLGVWLAAQPARACWIEVPLESLVAAADAIVVGRIAHVTRAGGEADYEYDVGTIAVRQVLKGGDLLRRLVGNTARVPLHFPARTNRLRVSTDLRYEKGQSGIWLLTLRQGRLMAARPDSLQPRSKAEQIRKLLAESPQETEPPPDLGPKPKLKKRLPIDVKRAR